MLPAEAYLKEHNADRTYWGKRLVLAEKRGRPTIEWLRDANEWTTCACGKQDPRLHRKDGRPVDLHLLELGFDFPEQLEQNQFLYAAKTLVKIEKRAHQVLKEMYKGTYVPDSGIGKVEKTS